MKVKICGITTLEDALASVDAGADLLGFNFYPASPRCISIETCARITAVLKARGCVVGLVGVFVNVSPAEMLATLDACALDLAQLSGDEPPETLAELRGRGFKALRPAHPVELEADLLRYPAHVPAPAWLVDAFRPGAYGGTGQTADWTAARRLTSTAPILLAGGLKPENVAEAVRQVRPWGVDTASGVESTPGRKDEHKLRAFIQAVREFEAKENEQ
jgi:phosphoribosylanthranilate isomerase